MSEDVRAMNAMFPKNYLGDGLYAEFDGFGIWVRSEDGVSVLNEVYFEPTVMDNLLEFNKRIGELRERHRKL